MATPVAPGRPPDWVPVERRWLGIDRRTFAPALAAIMVIFVFRGVLPVVDSSVSDGYEIKAGDVVDLGAGFTMLPAEGWTLSNGQVASGQAPASHLSATLTNAGIEVSVTTGPFTGTPAELLDHVKRIRDAYTRNENQKYLGDAATTTTERGDVGIVQQFSAVNIEGVLAVFVIDGVGVDIVVTGPPGSLAAHDDEISDMIASVRGNDSGAAQ